MTITFKLNEYLEMNNDNTDLVARKLKVTKDTVRKYSKLEYKDRHYIINNKLFVALGY